MPITIGSNIASLSAQRRLSDSTSQLSKTFERLSSGQRINKAADDAAGLAISESLKSDRRVFNQGVRNFNDGLSLLNIADSSLESLGNIVIRLKELAEQSANGVYSSKQRDAIDKEAQALSKEYTRIAQTTKFNGLNLFNGSTYNVRLQGGYGLSGGISQGLGGAVGTGTFITPTTQYEFLGAESYNEAILKDINNDGLADMSAYSTSDGQVTIFLNQGNGTFGSGTRYAMAGSTVFSLAFGDLNGDGIQDLITSGQTGGAGHSSIRLGRGDGTFGNSTSYVNGAIAGGESAVGDVNGDGILDLVTAANTVGGVRLGVGDGTFGAASTFAITAGYLNLADLNGDGNMDMVTNGASGGAAQVAVRLSDGNGGFSSATNYQTRGLSSFTTYVADVNNDSYLDLIDVGGGGTAVLLNRGNGTFGAYLTVAVGVGAVGDVNGDGNVDLASDFGVAFGNGNGTFGSFISSTPASTTFSTNTQSVSLGDMNGDGVLDLVAASYNGDPAGFVSVHLSSTTSGVSSLLAFNLKSIAESRSALNQFDRKLSQIGQQRGIIGAFQSRVSVGINNLQAASENYAAAESRIRDADIAAESSNLTRLNILQQASSAVLAQANQQPALAFTLLT